MKTIAGSLQRGDDGVRNLERQQPKTAHCQCAVIAGREDGSTEDASAAGDRRSELIRPSERLCSTESRFSRHRAVLACIDTLRELGCSGPESDVSPLRPDAGVLGAWWLVDAGSS